MKIAQVPRRFVRSHWGGTETVILETSRRLSQMGHVTEILCPNALADAPREVMGGITIRRFPYFYPYLGLSRDAKRQLDLKGGNIFSFGLMGALLRFPGLDCIHLHTGKRIGGICRHVARRRRIPYVLSLHGGIHDVPAEEAKTWTDPSRRAWEWGKLLGWWVGSRRVLEDAAAILCVGEEERVRTSGRYPNKKVLHLPNGVDPGRFATGDGPGFRNRYGIPGDAYVVLLMGRIDPQKNQGFLLRHFKALMGVTSKVHGLIVGPVTTPAYSEALVKDMAEKGLSGRITLIPGLPSEGRDLVDAYHAADLFLLPSVHEPFGIVILEAWASGLPVLASRVGGIPSFVEDGKDGILFDLEDEAGFMEDFSALVSSPERARSLAMQGQKKAETAYSWDRITERLVRIYEEAIHENPLRQ